MNVLISIPSIPFSSAENNNLIKEIGFQGVIPFIPSGYTLDVYPKEMKDLLIHNMWSVGIPHWSLKQNGTSGVAGPGFPKDELFYPEGIKEELKEVCRSYDKWRPYPAESVTNYTIDMANKLSSKRGRMFDYIFKYEKFEMLFWAEHAPASLAHLDIDVAMSVFDKVVAKGLKVVRQRPRINFVIFSPYGVGRKEGFVVSNRIDTEQLNSWSGIRRYLSGKL